MEPTSNTLTAYLSDQPWSFSRLIFDLDNLIDSEGRPIGERRARAGIRKDVEMDVQECPFDDGRKGQFMNVSAYHQVSRYYADVMSELAWFREQGEDNWQDILASVIDQLAQPAWYVVEHPGFNWKGDMPGLNAVGHKLGAGLFGVMREVVRQIALGIAPEPTAENFSALVKSLGALKGASEVCAGPPSMIKHTVDVLFNGEYKDKTQVSEQRVAVARILASQVIIGAYWAILDHRYCNDLLLGHFSKELKPANRFLQSSLERSADELSKEPVPGRPIWQNLPAGLNPAFRRQVSDVLAVRNGDDWIAKDYQRIYQALTSDRRVLAYQGNQPEKLALACLQYLELYRLFHQQLGRMEVEIRTLLGYPKAAGVELGRMVFPTPRALPWFERLVGQKFERQSWRLTGSSQGLVLPEQAG